MRFNDAVFGVILIIFAAAEIAYTQTFPSLYGQDFGPDLFPILIGVGLMLCGAILVVRGIATRAEAPLAVLGDWSRDRRKLINLALLICSLLLYILASDAIGFIPISLIILTVLIEWILKLLLNIIQTHKNDGEKHRHDKNQTGRIVFRNRHKIRPI